MPKTIPTGTLEKFTTFGDLLRFLRRRTGITQTELSIQVGYSTAQISRLEQNLRLPDIPTIEARFVSALDLEEEPQALARLLDLAANVRREDAPIPGLCPYKGLNYFDESDADLFVGREALTAILTERVLALTSGRTPYETRFLAIVGASGSGKSSLVRAGIVPTLRWNKTSADWQIHILTPKTHPLESLAESLTRESDSVSATTTLMDDLSNNPRSLHLFVKRQLRSENNSHILLVVDQFEELFALCRSETERSSFISNLLTAASEALGPTIVIITLRADFYAFCADYPQLREALAQHQEYIGSMTRDELCRAIEEPAQRGRWELEPGLVDLLLHDVGLEPGALPLLSHALLETWQRRRGRELTLGGYTSSGGVRGAIAETAEAVFHDQFTHQQQILARRIFLRLTELSDDTSTGDTRRRATINELISKPEEAEATRAVLKTLADARLITTTDDAAEVAHEALIREWPTLRGWLEDNREALRLHRHLTTASQEWSASNHEVDTLYRGVRLTQVREWAVSHTDEMNDLEREFLTASIENSERESAEREAQRQYELLTALKLAETEKAHAEENAQSASRLQARNQVITKISIVATLLALVAGIFGLLSNRYAREARANSAHAESLRLASQAEVVLSRKGNAETAALLSIRALQSSYSIQADAALNESLDHLYNRQFFKGHTREIYSVAFSPDGKYILTGSQDGTARLWDAQTSRVIQQFISYKGGVSAVAFSPDGKFALTGDNDAIVHIWDVSNGQEIGVFKGHTGGISAVVFSPDGRTIVTASADHTARLWDFATQKEIRVFNGHTDFVSDVAFSPDGQSILTGSFDNTAILWKTNTGQNIQTFIGSDADFGRRITSVVFSPDGKQILLGSDDHTAHLWSISSDQETCAFTGHTDSIQDVTFSPDGRFVATASKDKTARVWDEKSCLELRKYAGHTATVKSVTFSPDGKSILTGSEDGTAQLWIAPPYESPRIFTSHTLSVTSVAFSPDGRNAITASEDATLRLWGIPSGKEILTFTGSTKAISSFVFSPDGRYVLSGSDDKTVRLWDTTTGRQIRIVLDRTGSVISIALSPDGKYILTIGLGDSLGIDALTVLWDMKTGNKVRTFNVGPSLYTPVRKSLLAFSPNGNNVLIGGTVFDVSTGKMLRNFLGNISPTGFIDTNTVGSVAFSPDGKYVVTGSPFNQAAQLWDVTTGKQLRSYIYQIAGVRSVAFSPDGKSVLAGLDNNIAYLWDTKTGQEVRELAGHTGPVNSVAFSPDGKYILTGSDDGTARLWDTDYHDTIRYTCFLLWRDFTKEERTQYNISDNLPTCPKP